MALGGFQSLKNLEQFIKQKDIKQKSTEHRVHKHITHFCFLNAAAQNWTIILPLKDLNYK